MAPEAVHPRRPAEAARPGDLLVSSVSEAKGDVDGEVVVRLGQMPKAFSFSEFLSPAYLEREKRPIVMVGNNGAVIDSVHLTILALNEECRKVKFGCFYHMELRQDPSKGHPCDMVFVGEAWGARSLSVWDASDWEQRLEMCSAVDKMISTENIIPICCRIMKCDYPLASASTKHTYASHSDPAIAQHAGILTYSRPLENKARVLLMYRHQHARPLLYLMDMVEHDSISTSFATPGDLSETFVPRWQSSSETVFGHTAEPPTRNARPLISHVANNREVVLTLLRTWSLGASVGGVSYEGHIVPFEFKDTKYTWQEIKNRIHVQDLEAKKRMLAMIKAGA